MEGIPLPSDSYQVTHIMIFENHPSITNIKSKSFDANFTFRDTSSSEVIKLIKTLNVKKASQKSDIPTKIAKLNADFFENFICKNFNYCLKKGEFRCVLKHADVLNQCIRRKQKVIR